MHSVQFTAGATNMLTFRNTAVGAGDNSVFIDAVAVCLVPPPPPATTTTQTTTTTATVVTDTYVVNSFRGVSADITALFARLSATERALSTATSNQRSMQVAMSTIGGVQVQALTRIADITNAISTAVSAIPPASQSTSQATGAPQIEVTSGGNLLINAPGRAVQIQSTCGVIDPCNLLAAMEALRAV